MCDRINTSIINISNRHSINSKDIREGNLLQPFVVINPMDNVATTTRDLDRGNEYLQVINGKMTKAEIPGHDVKIYSFFVKKLFL